MGRVRDSRAFKVGYRTDGQIRDYRFSYINKLEYLFHILIFVCKLVVVLVFDINSVGFPSLSPKLIKS